MAAKRPNVIFIMADDMGYGDFNCINGGLSQTPHLNRLHEHSMRFSQAYTASPVCAPARAGALTGRYPLRTGCVDLNDINGLNRLEPGEVTLADVFQRGGYVTGLVGKWHCGTVPECRPENRGFREVEAFHPQGKDFWNWTVDRNGQTISANGRYLTHYLTERAVDFIDRHHEEPFFLHLAHYAPHRPLQAPGEVVAKYARDPRLTPGQAVVYAMIEMMDEGIGQVLDALERHGILDHTMVIFTSDNGPDDLAVDGLSPVRFNCGLRGQKYSVHDGGIRVPFLVQWPERLSPGDNDRLFHFVDLLPTLAAACSLEIPDGPPLDGDNRLPAWCGEEGEFLDARYWQWNRYYPARQCNAAIREGRWKLVIPAREGYREMSPDNVAMTLGQSPCRTWPPSRDREAELGDPSAPLLFDMKEDPGETQDRSRENPRLTRSMHTRLSAWFDEARGQLDAILDRRFPEPIQKNPEA